VCADEPQGIAISSKDVAKARIADASRLCQHGIEHRSQITGRAGDDLEHVRSSRLLLKGLAQFVEEARILNGDDRLSGEILNKCNLPVSERSDLLPG
jgi:hypothetical protein